MPTDTGNTTPRIRVLHPTANANVRAVVGAFARRGMLERFHTCIGVAEDERNPLARRFFARRPCPARRAQLRRQPFRESLRLLSERTGLLPALRRHETGPLCIDRVYRALDAAAARDLAADRTPPDAVYAYEDGALATFRAARERGVCRLYDLPIGYWRAARRIQAAEAERRPDWAATMPALRDSDAKTTRKDAELKEADTIFVASRFTARSLRDAPFPLAEPVVIPYGCPPVSLGSPPRRNRAAPLKVLYVGALSQRKGVADLLDAVDRLGSGAELTLVGKQVAPCRPLETALRRHHWRESLPHAAILETMREHDVFVFPSFFEGFGLVITEALSQGLPVIATPNTCAPDVMRDGREGFIVPTGDPEAIATKLETLHQDRAQLDGMREAALATARATTWEAYQKGLAEAAARAVGKVI